MATTRAWTALLAVVALVLAGCGGGDAAGDGGGDGDDGGGTVVATASTDLGTVLVDGEGHTLYLFDEDDQGASACSGGCAETWPPLVGEPSAGDGADGELLGTIERDDGDTQVTYAGMPLYRYAPDQGPGDVSGQGVGGVWWVVSPAGERLTEPAGDTGGTPSEDASSADTRPNY